MKPVILGLLVVLFAAAYLAQDINEQSQGCTDEEGCVEAAQGAGEPLNRVARQTHVCVKTPKKCLKNNGVCINLVDDCAGKKNDTLCNNDHCTCCQKHVCLNTPKKCSSNNGVCINLMDDCAGKKNDTLCNNDNCTCCQKHVCLNTPKKCSEKNGTCINLMDDCAGTKNDTLCNNRHCTCCIPA
ncbi:extracellular matrix protein A-like [Penaeus vannamei]|uniref:extracellular matrix protein A-like n=1 Tax=Penaeus vannamei TaxID=6689 RepID=UPI00387F8C64